MHSSYTTLSKKRLNDEIFITLESRLNLLEILWRFIKYHWLPFAAYISLQGVVQAVEDIFIRLGKDYTITFHAK